MFPSKKKLEEFCPGYGAELRRIFDDKDSIEEIKEVRDWLASCHHSPRLLERRLYALDVIAKTCGVEYIASTIDTCRTGCGLSYLNTGDTYVLTIIYDHLSDTWSVRSIDDVLDARPGRYV
jgi:hypothetical protein